MRIIILEDPEQVSLRAADMILEQVRRKPDSVLGLATGSTPLGTYRELVRQHRAGSVSFMQTTTFNLDEYVGLGRDHPQSYYQFMYENLFSQADFDLSRCHVPCGLARNLERYCESYESQIRQCGGIDLQILGVGTDGHIGFNEPGSSLGSRTRVKGLAERTRQDNARFFEHPEQVPRLAITMGVGTILEAKRIVLLATGAKKAASVRSFVEGPITSQIAASALQLHPATIVLLDRASADWLERRDYYEQMESLQQELDCNAISRAD